MKDPLVTSPEYRQFISELKARVLSARISAARAVNRDVVLLYWDIGRAIVEKQTKLGWGNSVVERVARDLRTEFPDTQGFSLQNLWRMRQFYSDHVSPKFLSQVVREMRKPLQRANRPAIHLGTGLRLLLCRTPVQVGAGTEGIFH